MGINYGGDNDFRFINIFFHLHSFGKHIFLNNISYGRNVRNSNNRSEIYDKRAQENSWQREEDNIASYMNYSNQSKRYLIT